MHRLLALMLALTAGLGCARARPDAGPVVKPAAAATTRYPIVLAHGILAGPSVAPFAGVRGALNVDGHVAFETTTHPVGSLPERAKLLGAQIDEIIAKTGSPRVNVIAHSMGGLDARWLAVNGWGEKFASITTISTPHRGASSADATRRILGPTMIGLVSDVAATFNAHLFGLPKYADWQGTLLALSEDNARAFNQATPDAPGVYYQSFAGLARPSGTPTPADREACGSMWPRTFAIQAAASAQFAVSTSVFDEGPSDGVVSVRSAKWGRFRGCLAADHMDEIGFYGNDNEGSRFDHITFYRLVALDLADMGF